MDEGPPPAGGAETERVDLAPDCRPSLLPTAVLLRRSQAELQIGLDPGWRVPDARGHWQRTLSGLDGRRSWRRIAAEERSIDPDHLGSLLVSLAGVGLAELTPRVGSPSGRVRLVGGSPISSMICCRLLDAGIEAHRAPPNHTHSIVGAHLTVLASEAIEADRTAAAELVRHDIPHLLVRLGPAGATVGPLVVPGRTACTHCTDLTRRDADPAWPRLLEQLQHRTLEACPTEIADWAASTTVTQVLGFLAGFRPDTYAATLEVTAPTYAVTWRAWSPHRECGCRWLGNTHELG